jgi:hypothetical protein
MQSNAEQQAQERGDRHEARAMRATAPTFTPARDNGDYSRSSGAQIQSSPAQRPPSPPPQRIQPASPGGQPASTITLEKFDQLKYELQASQAAQFAQFSAQLSQLLTNNTAPASCQTALVPQVHVNNQQQFSTTVLPQEERWLGRGYTRPTPAPVRPDAGDIPDYISDADSHGSRRSRAENRRQGHQEDELDRRRIARNDDACKEYTKAHPPAFNENDMDIWCEQFMTLLSSLPAGRQLVSALQEHPDVGIYSSAHSSSVYQILSRAFDSKNKDHARALSSIITASKRNPSAPAYAAYTSLVAEFLPDGTITTTALHHEFHHGALPQESGFDYVHRLESIVRRLDSLGHPVGNEDFQAATIIQGLPDEYKSLRQAYFARSKSSWTIADVKSSIKDIDFNKARNNGVSGGAHHQDGAFLSTSSDRRTCLRCHRPGHLAQDCPAPRPHSSHGKTQSGSSGFNQQKNSGRPINYSNDEKATFLEQKAAELRGLPKHQPGKKYVSFLAAKAEVSEEPEESTYDSADRGVALEDMYRDEAPNEAPEDDYSDTTFMAIPEVKHTYIRSGPKPTSYFHTTIPPCPALRNDPEQRSCHAVVDSGASKHISAVRTDFGNTLREIKNPFTIGGVCVKAVGIGSVTWNVTDTNGQESTVRLSNVLYAPQLLRRTSYHTRLISTRLAGREGYRFDLGDLNNGMFTLPGSASKYHRFYLPIVGGVPVLPVQTCSPAPHPVPAPVPASVRPVRTFSPVLLSVTAPAPALVPALIRPVQNCSPAPPPVPVPAHVHPVSLVAEDSTSLSSTWHARLGHP